MRASLLVLLLAPASFALNKHVAIVTGGTRGIGKGIAEALASQSFDLLLTYNSDADAAEKTAAEITEAYGCAVECVGGDVSQPATRDAIFAKFDEAFKATHALGAVVHNAGQYVGVTSSNADGIGPSPQLGFGDGSLLGDDGAPDLSVMHYYQRMYGDAYVDLCERGLARMGEGGGSLVGISSPGCTLTYKANLGYDMPGSGKCVMEYAMRLFALRAAKKNVNCNVVIPGVTTSDAWGKLADARGADVDEMVGGIAGRIAPMGSMAPRAVGDGVAFLCSPAGRAVTGVSLPVDNGVHLKT